MKHNTLSTIHTSVAKLLVLVLVTSFAKVALSQTTEAPKTGCTNAEAAGLAAVERSALTSFGGKQENYIAYLSGLNDPKKVEAANKIFEKGYNSCMGISASVDDSNPEACAEASKEFNEAVGKLNEACGPAGLGGSTARSCSYKVIDCQTADALTYSQIQSGNGATDLMGAVAAGMNGQMPTGGSTPRMSSVPDLDSAERRFRNCPHLAGEGLDELRDAMKEEEEHISDLDTQLLDAQAALVEKQNADQENLKNIKDQMTDTQLQAEDDMEEIRLQLQEFDENIANQLTKYEGLIQAQNNVIQNLTNAQTDAYNQYLAAITQLNLQCHASALTAVGRLQQNKQALIKQSSFSAGGFNNLMKSVGVSNSKAAQKIADDFYRQCTSDRAYTSNVEVAHRAYEAANKRAEDAKTSARNTIASINDQINKLQGEMKLKGLDNFNRRIDRLQSRLQVSMMRLQENYMMETQKAMSSMFIAQQKISKLQNEVAIAKQTSAQRAAYYAIKNAASGGRNTDKADTDKLFSANSNALSKSEWVKSACGGVKTEESFKMCKAASEFLPENYEIEGETIDCEPPEDSSDLKQLPGGTPTTVNGDGEAT